MNPRIALAVILLAAASAAISQSPPPSDAPKQSGIVEHEERRLAQVDVSVEGPPEQIANLTVDQFRLLIDGQRVVPTAMDRLCEVPTPGATEADRSASASTVAPAARTSYLFYFDQANLKMVGHQDSLDTAKGMIAKLIVNGNRGAIVSSGKRVVTFAPFTSNQQPLFEALERIRSDMSQWDDFASLEGSKASEVVRTTSWGRNEGCQLANVYQREEFVRARAALERFVAVLGRFAEVDPPKVAIYFADTLRSHPGRHYLRLGGTGCEDRSFSTDLSFQTVHDRAATLGVKLYAVQAEGLTSAGAGNPAGNDAQAGLKNLTLETGGDAFLNGASVESMTRTIEADSACIYLLSFDPAPFPTDTVLSVRVKLAVKGVRARTRTSLVIQSESERRISTLLAAFAAPSDVQDAVHLQGGIVPLEVNKGKLRALVQMTLPETTLPGEEWDLGMSLVSNSVVKHQASARMSAPRPGVRLVLESEMDIAPGPFDLTLVGMESVTEQVATGRLAGDWPEAGEVPRITSTTVMQPADGAFLRDGKLRTSGSLVVADGEPVRADRPIALVTLVCKAGKSRDAITIQRALTGASSSTFPAIELPANSASCLQVRDVIPAGTLAAGPYGYSIRVEGSEAVGSRDFTVN